MSKELETLKRIKSHYNDRVCIDILEDFDIIEDALKRLAVYETFDLLDEKDDVDKLTDIKGKLTYVDKVMDTQERLLESVSADEIRILNSVLNSQIKTLKKKLKAMEVIKELFDFDFAIRYGDNQPMIKITNKRNGQYWELPETTEICDLLKEVLL